MLDYFRDGVIRQDGIDGRGGRLTFEGRLTLTFWKFHVNFNNDARSSFYKPGLEWLS